MKTTPSLSKTLDPYSPPGTKVAPLYENGKPVNGYDHDRERVQLFLREDGVYTVEKMFVGAFSTAVELVEIPGVRFNSVCLYAIEEQPSPEILERATHADNQSTLQSPNDEFKWKLDLSQSEQENPISDLDVRIVDLPVKVVFEWSDEIASEYDEETGAVATYTSGYVMNVVPNQQFVYIGQETILIGKLKAIKTNTLCQPTK